MTGNIEPELKLAYAQEFTKVISKDYVIDKDDFSLRVLLATAGCIGAGLDCTNVFLVIRIGSPIALQT